MHEKRSFGSIVAGKRGKWVTLLVWIALAGILSMWLPSVNDEEINNAPNLPNKAPSVQDQLLIDKEFPSSGGVPALLVWHREGPLTDEDLTHITNVTASLEASPVSNQVGVLPLHSLPLPVLNTLLSEDQSTLVLPVLFDKSVDVEQLSIGVDELTALVAKEFGSDPTEVKVDSTTDISLRVTGPVGIQIDATGLFANADVSLLIGTVMLVLIILLLIYRSPILALIPIVAVGFAYGVVGPLLGAMAREGWITVDAQGISIMTVLLFGAGTDYCIFLIARFRQYLYTEENKSKALFRAITGASGAIAMSGFTVVLSLFALIFAQYGAYERFAVPFSLSILIMGIASLTLVPALLAIFGRASFFPFIPRTPEMQIARAVKKNKPARVAKSPSASILGNLVVRRPWTIVIVTVVLLGGLALVGTQIKFTFDILSSFPKDMASREGFATIGKQFSPGELAPVEVIINTEGKTVALGEQLAALPYVDQVSEPQTGIQNANLQSYSVQLSMNPYSMEAMEHIPDLRAVAEQSLEQAGISNYEELVWIGGQTSTQYDTKVTGDRDSRLIMPIVIGMIALLLLLYLRSVVAMLYLVGTVVLSYFSALGLGWLVVHYGLGADAISGAIPLYSFVFLVALGEDYNIFMISSIWQKSKIMPLRQAIKEGVGETSAVITSAGLILAGTFAVLATLPIQVLVQFGIITAIGVLLDTFIVRPFLVPALTVLVGRYAFWPGKHVTIPEADHQ
jgi:RND superfamily putative drug exporter